METLLDEVPEPLETYCRLLDSAFSRPTQRDNLRTYLLGLLLGSERHKTTTGLANTEPGKLGSKHKAAQRLQWFLSESSWDPDDLHQARLTLMRELPDTKPDENAVLVIDETGDRKYGKHTAHVGRQYLGSLGKVDSGVVSVHVLYAREHAYFPLLLKPYTPAHHFKRKTSDPAFRTKPQLATLLIEAVKDDWPFRAVVADNLYGRNDEFKGHLIRHLIPFVMTLPSSYTWWHFEGEDGSVEELAWNAPPEAWQRLIRTFADGHQEVRWVAEVEGGPFGRNHTLRLVVVTTDPVKLPEQTTEYLISNLRWGEDDCVQWHVKTKPASPAEIALLYARRPVIELAYREVKQHLGWAQYQVRSDIAIQRHWALVCAAFCFLWWYAAQHLEDQPEELGDEQGASEPEAKHRSWSGWLRTVRLWLEPFVLLGRYWRAFSEAKPPRVLRELLERCRRGVPLMTFAA